MIKVSNRGQIELLRNCCGVNLIAQFTEFTGTG